MTDTAAPRILKHPFSIAIDGPVASGKGTLAAAIAKLLGITYIYTGAMYRALALACLETQTDIHDAKAVLALLQASHIDLPVPLPGKAFIVTLNGNDITERITHQDIDITVPVIAAYAPVREEMVRLQKTLAKDKSVIVEGRDIATHVLPDADLKVYLTASIEARAKRRFEQAKQRGQERTYEAILKDLRERDERDITRYASPLTVVSDAFLLDTTDLNLAQTIDAILTQLRKKGIIA